VKLKGEKGGTMHKKLTVATLIILCSVIGSWAGIAAASQPTHLEGSYTAPCGVGDAPSVDVTGTYNLLQRGNLIWGTWSFVAANGKSVHYTVRYQLSDTPAEVLTGKIVVANNVIGRTWLYVDGTVHLSLGGYFFGYGGTAVDICQDLGVN
jgi:hypothetical protein